MRLRGAVESVSKGVKIMNGWFVVSYRADGNFVKPFEDLQEAYRFYDDECKKNGAALYWQNGEAVFTKVYGGPSTGSRLRRLDIDEKIKKALSAEEAEQWEKIRAYDGIFFRENEVYLVFRHRCGHWSHGTATPYTNMSEDDSKRQLLYEAAQVDCTGCILQRNKEFQRQYDASANRLVGKIQKGEPT